MVESLSATMLPVSTSMSNQRAFRPAEAPPDATGLSQFGMGMKSAACWFGRKLTVRSKALGENVERVVTLDIDSILTNRQEHLPVVERPMSPAAHYTELVLERLYKPPQGRTLAKIKDHLASIYRVFLRDNVLTIRLKSATSDEHLAYTPPQDVLVAPPDNRVQREHDLGQEPIEWKKEISFDFGSGQKVAGFAALGSRANTEKAGFALFRRNRLIEGSGENSYRPSDIFGASTTATYQRLFGELHLEGFDISHTKDGFRWDEDEEPFLALLKERLNSDPLPLLDQARYARYQELRRTRGKQKKKVQEEARTAVEETAEVLEITAEPLIEKQVSEPTTSEDPPEILESPIESWDETFHLEVNGYEWEVTVEIANDPAIGDWITVFDAKSRNPRQLGVRLSAAHPFMERFVGPDPSRLSPFLRIAAAIGLSEITARDAGVKQAGQLRRNINQLLRESLSEA